MSVYVLALACVLHGSCQQGYFILQHPGFVDCQKDVLPMVEGHRIKDRAGNVVVWHAQSCLESKNPPANRQMLGMF
ncbi:MAG TPA: hypothetical protein VF410_05085 [Rhizomicrobium sp.]